MTYFGSFFMKNFNAKFTFDYTEVHKAKSEWLMNMFKYLTSHLGKTKYSIWNDKSEISTSVNWLNPLCRHPFSVNKLIEPVMKFPTVSSCVYHLTEVVSCWAAVSCGKIHTCAINSHFVVTRLSSLLTKTFNYQTDELHIYLYRYNFWLSYIKLLV